MRRDAFERWFSRWLLDDEVWRFLTRHGVTSFMSGGCDVLAVALQRRFPLLVIGAESLVLKNKRRFGMGYADHVGATLVFSGDDSVWVADGMGLSSLRFWASRWARYEGLPRSHVLQVPWNTMPIDKDQEDLNDSASELVELMR